MTANPRIYNSMEHFEFGWVQKHADSPYIMNTDITLNYTVPVKLLFRCEAKGVSGVAAL